MLMMLGKEENMKIIKQKLGDLFLSFGIEYFSSVRMKDTNIIKPHILEKLDFTPRCAIVYLVPYYGGRTDNISAYAAARDYHIFLAEVGGRVSEFLKNEYGKQAAGFGDHSPIDERDAAAKCGLGILGDNGLLINEKYGSYVFIGEILTDALPEELDTPKSVSPEACIHCGRCKSLCPMPDLGVCLSSLTQKKGTLTEKEREHIKKYGSVWGCDLCQIHCPYNKKAKITPIVFFLEERTPHLSKAAVETMTDEEFASRAYSWRGKHTLLRNIEIFE